jgi:hypothetical protein
MALSNPAESQPRKAAPLSGPPIDHSPNGKGNTRSKTPYHVARSPFWVPYHVAAKIHSERDKMALAADIRRLSLLLMRILLILLVNTNWKELSLPQIFHDVSPLC